MPAALMQDDLGGASAFGSIIVPTGKRDMQLLQYFKSVAFHNWLFGIEITGVHDNVIDTRLA